MFIFMYTSTFTGLCVHTIIRVHEADVISRKQYANFLIILFLLFYSVLFIQRNWKWMCCGNESAKIRSKGSLPMNENCEVSRASCFTSRRVSLHSNWNVQNWFTWQLASPFGLISSNEFIRISKYCISICIQPNSYLSFSSVVHKTLVNVPI